MTSSLELGVRLILAPSTQCEHCHSLPHSPQSRRNFPSPPLLTQLPSMLCSSSSSSSSSFTTDTLIRPALYASTVPLSLPSWRTVRLLILSSIVPLSCCVSTSAIML